MFDEHIVLEDHLINKVQLASKEPITTQNQSLNLRLPAYMKAPLAWRSGDRGFPISNSTCYEIDPRLGLGMSSQEEGSSPWILPSDLSWVDKGRIFSVDPLPWDPSWVHKNIIKDPTAEASQPSGKQPLYLSSASVVQFLCGGRACWTCHGSEWVCLCVCRSTLLSFARSIRLLRLARGHTGIIYIF